MLRAVSLINSCAGTQVWKRLICLLTSLPPYIQGGSKRRRKKPTFKIALFFWGQGVGVLLASYTWGDDALRFTGMTDEEVIKETIEGVAELHNQTFKYVNELFLRGVVKRWSLDENTLGAFASFYPYQVRRIFCPLLLRATQI